MNRSAIIAIALGSIMFIVGIMFAYPLYNVWQQGLAGEAELKRAEQSRQIVIKRAKAEQEAAQYTAKAIEIVGAVAQKYPEYRKQEFISAFGEALNNGDIETIIYVPTEANIPLIEVSRLLNK